MKKDDSGRGIIVAICIAVVLFSIFGFTTETIPGGGAFEIFLRNPFGYAAGHPFIILVIIVALAYALGAAIFGTFAYVAHQEIGWDTFTDGWYRVAVILGATMVFNVIPSIVWTTLAPYWDYYGIGFLKHAWWLIAFFILGPTFKSAWLAWRQEMFMQKSKFKLLEIRIPREIEVGPYAMDQVFQAIWQLSNAPGHFMEQYMDGEVPRPYSFEIVSFGGELHMYVRGYQKLVPLIVAAFGSYYPGVELVEVDDYINKLPATYSEVRGKGYELWGTELLLTREAAYPTRTYEEFERPDDETQIDPIGSLLEVLSKTKKEEVMAIQFNLIAAPGNWAKDHKVLVETLKNPPVKDKENPFAAMFKTPRETDILKAVQENLSRRAFDAIIRVMYFSPKPYYYDSFPRRGMLGAFNQYAAADLNSFTQNFSIVSLTMIWYKPYFFPKWRQLIRSQRFMQHYRTRMVPPETWVARALSSKIFHWENTKFTRLTTTIMATLFHPPMKTVLTAPIIKRAESKTAGPSAGLPIYGEESAIEKFQ